MNSCNLVHVHRTVIKKDHLYSGRDFIGEDCSGHDRDIPDFVPFRNNDDGDDYGDNDDGGNDDDDGAPSRKFCVFIWYLLTLLSI